MFPEFKPNLQDNLNQLQRRLQNRLPRNDVERVRSHLEGLFDALQDGFQMLRETGAGVYPAINLTENENEFFVSAELPGVAPEDLDLSMQQDSLTISGERKIESQTGVNHHRRERESGSFSRVVSLPSPVDPDAVTAKFNHGVLQVTLPKAVNARPRRIDIRAE
jgi:HSP20 family protein